MNEKVSFEGIGEVAATFYAEDGVKAGEVVKLSADSTVSACADGDRFCGVALGAREGCAGVQIGGLAQVKCDDAAVAPGYVLLCADGAGGVKKADSGVEHLVVSVESGWAAIMM